MKIVEDLLTATFSNSSDCPITDVLIGLHWTGVHSYSLGLAATQPEKECCFAEDIRDAGSLQEKSAFELAEYLRSPRPLEACVGMAALNSCLNIDGNKAVELNARDLIMRRGMGKRITLIGHYAFTEQIRNIAEKLWVLELNPNPGDLPTSDAPQYLPQSDVIGITATTLTNGTFENFRGLFPTHALVVMMGPTTPLSTVLFDHGIHVVAGIRVTQPLTVMRLIGQCSPLHRPIGMQRLTFLRDKSLLK